METQLINIDQIKISKNRRFIDQDKVEALADSIEFVGLLTPISLDQELKLIAGLHRLEAFKLLSKDKIPAIIINNKNDLEKELIEIDENLIRNELDDEEMGDLIIKRDNILRSLGLRAKIGRPSKKGAPGAPFPDKKNYH